jgi:YidC/Oxa1 family membrane protein insertase
MHKKDMIQMVIVIALIVMVYFAFTAWLMPAPPPPPAQPTEPTEPGEPAAIRSQDPSTARPSEPTEPEPGFNQITRDEARTYNLANSRLTAVISERGAMLDSLRFTDSDGNIVYWRTPDNPRLSPTEALELLGQVDATPDHIAPLALVLDDNDSLRNTSRWELVLNESGDPAVGQSLTFRFPHSEDAEHEADGTVIFKRITLLPGTYRLDVDVRIENHSQRVREKVVGLWGAVGITNDGMRTSGEYTRVALYGSMDSRRWLDLESSPRVADIGRRVVSRNQELGRTQDWIGNRDYDKITQPDRFLAAHGLRTQYFLAFLSHDPDVRDPRWSGAILPIAHGRDGAISLIAPPLQVPAARDGTPGEAATRMMFYSGPRDRDMLNRAWLSNPPTDELLPVQWAELATAGFFDLIAAPLVWLLRILSGWVGTGLAIIFLTLIVRFALSPLSYRGQKSMATYAQKMKVVKPKLDAIKEKYKGKSDRDSQMKMLTETRAAMKEQNVGMLPLGGCLPMLLQLPIFIGLYHAFGASFFLRQAEFLWIRDLSLPDATFPGDAFVGDSIVSFIAYNGFLTINILPMLWIVLSIVQFKLQPKPDDPQQAAMQKQMGCIFPIMGMIFYGFASGFAFYFIVSSVYSIVESKLVRRNLVKQGVLPPPKKKGAVKDGDKPDYHSAAATEGGNAGK